MITQLPVAVNGSLTFSSILAEKFHKVILSIPITSICYFSPTLCDFTEQRPQVIYLPLKL